MSGNIPLILHFLKLSSSSSFAIYSSCRFTLKRTKGVRSVDLYQSFRGIEGMEGIIARMRELNFRNQQAKPPRGSHEEKKMFVFGKSQKRGGGPGKNPPCSCRFTLKRTK